MNAKSRRLGWLAGVLSVLAPRKAKPAAPGREFRIGTQRMGVRWTDRLRDHFRTHWIKSSRRN